MKDSKKNSDVKSNFHEPRKKVVLSKEAALTQKKILQAKLKMKRGPNANPLKNLGKGGFGKAKGESSSFYLRKASETNQLKTRAESKDFECENPLYSEHSENRTIKEISKQNTKKRKR